MSDPLLVVKNLKTWLGSSTTPAKAVDGVSFSINKGETLCLLGESGCGKSMSALSLMRLLPPSGRIVEGQVNFNGNNLLDLPENAMRKIRGGKIGMIFQEPMTSLNPVMTIGDQISEAIKLHDPQGRKNIKARLIELLQQVGIPDPESRIKAWPHQLSGGMKQRIMIAMTLAGRPDFLIADEPTTALDVTIQAQVLKLLKQIQQKTGMAILLITHDLGVVAEVADRVMVMYAGEIIESATKKDFFNHPVHPYSRALFSSLPSDHKRGSRLAVIEGSVPPLTNIFKGCRFAERCQKQQDQCHTQIPPWNNAGYRCFYPEQDHPLEHLSNTPVSPIESKEESEITLDVEHLKVHFPIYKGVFRRVVGHIKAVDGVSLKIPKGKTVALVGESGCGKTTAGKGILQLEKPTSGKILFKQQNIAHFSAKDLKKMRKEMQVVFQDPVSSMNPRMLVGQIIAEGLIAQKMVKNRQQRDQKVAELLTQVGLSKEAADRYPHEFSGGQRQRICIARALAVEPQLIICDEPTSALDVSVQAQVLNLLADLQRDFGLSYLFITHDLSVVSYLAYEVAVMYLGQIVEYGRTDEILNHPQHPYTQALLSAVLQVDPAKRQQQIILAGDMPSPANPPSGCYFHPRCPQATADCQQNKPPFVQISNSHYAHCHLL